MFLNTAKYLASHPLTRDAQARAWLRFVGWQMQSRLRDEVVVPWVGGQRLAARRGMAGATGNIYAGLHEFAAMMLTLHFLRAGDLFLDIGANVGSYTVLASGVAGSQVWAFEPDPHSAQSIRRNVELNGLGRLVSVHELAVGEFQDTVAFTTHLDTMNRVAIAGDSDTRLVRQESIDNFIGEHRPAMIKMDVEGGEDAALRGCRELLSHGCVKVLELESVSPDMELELFRLGFEQIFYNPFKRSLDQEQCDPYWSTPTYVADRPFVEARLASAPRIEVLDHSL